MYSQSLILDPIAIHRPCKDVVLRLLDKKEATRLGSKSGASEVKQHKWFAKINWGLLRNIQPPVSVCHSCLFYFALDLVICAAGLISALYSFIISPPYENRCIALTGYPV